MTGRRTRLRALAVLLALFAFATPADAAPPREGGSAARATAPARAQAAAVDYADGRNWGAVLVAADDAQDVFDRAAQAFRDEMRRRGVPESRLVVLSARPRPGVRPATRRELGAALTRAASGAEALFLFVTSHGNEQGLYLAAEDRPLPPAALDRLLTRTLGDRPTVAVLSGCYSGVYLQGSLRRPNRVLLTAARPDRPSFGCSNDETYSFFDAAALGALPRTGTWAGWHRATRRRVAARERELGFPESGPQAWIGPHVAQLPIMAAPTR